MSNLALRGIKRKRSALPSNDNEGSFFRQKLHHELREIKKATKKAKSFEVRKIIKRLRSLESKGTDTPETEDLAEQLLILKHLDIEITSNTAFVTKTRKNKQLRTNDVVQAAINEEIGLKLLVQAQAGTAAYRAQSRLLSSRTLAEQVASVVNSLESILQPLDAEINTPGMNIAKKARAVSSAEEPASHIVAGDKSGTGAKADDNTVDTETGWESGSVSDGDGEWESGTVEEDVRSVSGDQVTDIPSDEEKVQDRNALVSKSSGLHSTFLPSLSVGFVRGNSGDSDLDESEVKIADPGRKNRRGQRARRAIWEKKYGRNANHKKEQECQIRGAKTRGLDSKQRHGRDIYKEHADTKANIRQDKKQDGPLAPNIADRPLHPSWEAKKQLKEKMTASIVPSQGKKIVF